jgi:hypothetical protein
MDPTDLASRSVPGQQLQHRLTLELGCELTRLCAMAIVSLRE